MTLTGTAEHSVKGGRQGMAMYRHLRAQDHVTPHLKKPNLRKPQRLCQANLEKNTHDK